MTNKSGKRPHPGDRVSWRSHGSTAEGEVEKEITERTEEAGRTVNASPDDPQYRVRSEKSGRAAVHRPEALEPRPPEEGQAKGERGGGGKRKGGGP